MRIANRTVTNTFNIPVSAPYDVNLYVQAKVPYADCLLGQGGYLKERCNPYRRVIDAEWFVHDKDGSVLRKGASLGTCCDYTTDERKEPVVSTTLGGFSLPAGTTVYLELKQKGDVSKLRDLAPRIVVQRSDPEESEMSLVLWSSLGTGALLLISLMQLIAAWLQYRTSQPTLIRHELGD
jgi:hypothetical protein